MQRIECPEIGKSAIWFSDSISSYRILFGRQQAPRDDNLAEQLLIARTNKQEGREY